MDEREYAELKKRRDDAEERMERLRYELARISSKIKQDPTRSMGTDKECWDKNMELSAAMREFVNLDVEYYGTDSEYYIAPYEEN